MAFLAQYFKQEVVDGVHADVDLVLLCTHSLADASPAAKRARRASSSKADAGTAGADVAADPLQLAKLPAHRFILNTSDYFKAQLGRHWQPSPPTPATPNISVHCSSIGSIGNAALAARPTVQLTINSAEQLSAAEAVIAAMYIVPQAITSLEEQQLVHVISIADMVNAADAQQQAVQALQAAAESEQGLSTAALQALASLSGWPSCLLQLLPTIVDHAPRCKDTAAVLAAVLAAGDDASTCQLLVNVFGDLQAVWADVETSTLLLQLPLPAMQLLLSSDQLRVPSEDTVLYTAKQYVRAQTQAVDEAKAALVPLIRAPQLSLFALSCWADREQLLLGCDARKLRRLLSLKRIASSAELPEQMAVFKGASASWQLGPRQIRPLEDGVQLEWRLPVEQLKQACRDSCRLQCQVCMHSPGSPPLKGAAWRLMVDCQPEENGIMVGVYAQPVPQDMPDDTYYKIRFTLRGHGTQHTYDSSCLTSCSAWGDNHFELQPMAGDGWDEVVWAEAGLPVTGEMLLQLHMHSVE